MQEMIQTALANTGSWLGSLDPLKVGILIFGGFFAFLMWLAHRTGELDWKDLITGKGTTKVSLTKLLQLIGGMTGTWVVMYQTMHNQLGTELFFAYLAYVASIEGYSKFMAAKYGVSDAPADIALKNANQQNPPPAPKVDDVINR